MNKYILVRLNLIQSVLIITAIVTGNSAWELGNKVYTASVSTGYGGGALALGTICASCVISLVFIESLRIKLNKKR